MSGKVGEYDADNPDVDFMNGQNAGDMIPEIEGVCEQIKNTGKSLGVTHKGDFIDCLNAWNRILNIATKNPNTTIWVV